MSLAWDEGWEVDRYQEEIERSERERREFGWDAAGGWARPQDPVCKRCWYVVVDGACAGCKERALSERGNAGGTNPPRPARSESAYGEEEAA